MSTLNDPPAATPERHEDWITVRRILHARPAPPGWWAVYDIDGNWFYYSPVAAWAECNVGQYRIEFDLDEQLRRRNIRRHLTQWELDAGGSSWEEEPLPRVAVVGLEPIDSAELDEPPDNFHRYVYDPDRRCAGYGPDPAEEAES